MLQKNNGKNGMVHTISFPLELLRLVVLSKTWQIFDWTWLCQSNKQLFYTRAPTIKKESDFTIILVTAASASRKRLAIKWREKLRGHLLPTRQRGPSNHSSTRTEQSRLRHYVCGCHHMITRFYSAIMDTPFSLMTNNNGDNIWSSSSP